MSAPDTPLLAELAARDEQTVAARARIREVDDQAQHARSEAARIKEELVEAFAADDQAQADKLTRAKAKADARAAEPWDERRAGAQRAAERVRGDRDTWVVTNITALLDELAPDAHEAAAAITAKAAELDQARRQWHGLEQRTIALLRVVSPEAARGVPTIESADTAIKDALRATAEIPPPLPRAHAAPQVMRADDHMLLEPGERLGDSDVSVETKEKFARIVAEQARAA